MFDKHARARAHTHTHTHTHTHMHREMVSMTPLPLQITSPWAGLTKRPKNHLDEESRPRAACRANLPTLRIPSTHIPAAPQRAVASAQAHFQPSSPTRLSHPLPAPATSQPVLLLHFRVLHLCNGIRGFRLLLLQVLRPHVVHPVHQVYLKSSQATVSASWPQVPLNRTPSLPQPSSSSSCSQIPPAPPPWVGAGWPRARRGRGR